MNLDSSQHSRNLSPKTEYNTPEARIGNTKHNESKTNKNTKVKKFILTSNPNFLRGAVPLTSRVY